MKQSGLRKNGCTAHGYGQADAFRALCGPIHTANGVLLHVLAGARPFPV
jgi:hypothetical protein